MIIWRYIGKEVCRTMLATMIVLLLILITNQLVHYLNQASVGQLSIQAVIAVVFLEVPTLLSFMLPLGTLLGLLITLGRLSSDHELIALFSCGFSRKRLYGMVISMAMVVAVLVLWLTGFVGSACRSWQKEVLVNSVKSASLKKVIPDEFLSLGHGGRVLYAGNVEAHARLGKVFFASPNVKEKRNSAPNWSLLLADEVSQERHDGGKGAFIFKKGQHFLVPVAGKQWETMTFQRYNWRIQEAKVSQSDSLQGWSLWRLWREGHHHSLAAQVEWQWRFALPLSVLALSLMAVSLTQSSPRQGRLMRLLPAVMLYVVYANLLFVCKNWLLEGRYPTWIGLWWLPIVPALFVLLYELKRWLSWRMAQGGSS